jgi:hypothetical protein
MLKGARRQFMSMTVLKREDMEQALALLESAPSTDRNVVAATEALKRALLDAKTRDLLTTAEAAEALGIRSINTVKRWVKIGYLHGVSRNERTMIPVTEVERIWHDDRVKALRASSRLHADIAELGAAGLSDDELAGLVKTRPGRPPWAKG